MHNSILPVVRFTDNEVKALFIAFMATRNQQLPYLKSRQSLAEKLLGLISETQQDDLVLLNQLLLLKGLILIIPIYLSFLTSPSDVRKLIQILLLDNHLLITMKEDEEIKSYPIYLLHLYQEKAIGLLKDLT